MQEFSVKRLLKTKNKSFFDLSIYQFLGMFGVLESDIKKLAFMGTGVMSHVPLPCFASRMITARNLAVST